MSICSLITERIYINHPLLIVDEITFDCCRLNLFSQRDSSTSDLVSDENNWINDNTNLKVKAIQPILMITEKDADDLLIKPYVLSAL